MERGGFEPPKASPTDLQSAPFDRSGTSPHSSYGAGDGTRTRNLLITNQLLYRLSYTSQAEKRIIATFPKKASSFGHKKAAHIQSHRFYNYTLPIIPITSSHVLKVFPNQSLHFLPLRPLPNADIHRQYPYKVDGQTWNMEGQEIGLPHNLNGEHK